MKFLKNLLIPLIFILISCVTAYAQDNTAVLNHIMSKTAKLYHDYPVEKVHLHFDKPYYAVGDTIWFKAYLTLDRHVPSELSKIIYVDMMGPRDSVLQSLNLQVKNSVAWSSIHLPATSFKRGNYRIVAYTNWMNNAGPAYFFNKNITVGNAINVDLSTQISLQKSIVNKQGKVTAGIYFKDGDGKPYTEKKVNWAAMREDESIARGHGETDKNGFLSVSFINLKNTSLDSARLITTIDNGDKKLMSTTFPLKSIARPNDLQFFPEGGELLVGVSTKVAFKAVKPDGLGIDVKGTVNDNTGKAVAEFSSSHLGMGTFEFTPEDGKTYTVKATFADGTTATPDLPKIQTGGMNLSLENSNANTLGLQLQADASFFKEFKDKTFFIIAKSSGTITFAAKTVLSNPVYNAA